MIDRRAGIAEPRGPAAPRPAVAAPESRVERLQPLLGLLTTRANLSPRWLVEPGPSADELDSLFVAAASAPDHGRLTPWRFVIVPAGRRSALAEAFALALIDRDPSATLEQIEAARSKAHRSPLLMLAIVDAGDEPDHQAIPLSERLISLGCAIQNIVLAAHAIGYGHGLTSGRAIASERIRALFGLRPSETAVCFINIGSVGRRQLARTRPQPQQFVTTL